MTSSAASVKSVRSRNLGGESGPGPGCPGRRPGPTLLHQLGIQSKRPIDLVGSRVLDLVVRVRDPDPHYCINSGFRVSGQLIWLGAGSWIGLSGSETRTHTTASTRDSE